MRYLQGIYSKRGPWQTEISSTKILLVRYEAGLKNDDEEINQDFMSQREMPHLEIEEDDASHVSAAQSNRNLTLG